MSLKSLTKKIPFWEISLVTLFFFTGYGVSVYKQSNPILHEKASSKSTVSQLVDNDMDLDLNHFLAGLEEAEWSDTELQSIPQRDKDPHLKRKKQARTLKKYQATHPNAQVHPKSAATRITSKKSKKPQPLDSQTKKQKVIPLASNAKKQHREPLFDTQDIDTISNEHLNGNGMDQESKEQLDSLFTLNDASEHSEAFVPNENGDNKSAPLKQKKAKKFKKKKKKIKNSVAPQDDVGIEARMADDTPAPDAFMGSWGEQEEDSFALAMNHSLQDTDEKWIPNEGGQDPSDWFTSAAQAQTPDSSPTATQPISDFIGDSTSIESSLKAFSNQNQAQENSEGLRGRAFDQDEYEYLTNQGFGDYEDRNPYKQAAWGGTLSAIEGSQFGPEIDPDQIPNGYFQDEQGATQHFGGNFIPNNEAEDYPAELRAALFGDSQEIADCEPTAPPVVLTTAPLPMIRPLPPRPMAHGRLPRRPPPPGFRAPNPRGQRPVAYRMLPPPPPPQWR